MSTVTVIMGSKSDLGTMEAAFVLLRQFGIDFEARILSAHRTPDDAAALAKSAESNGTRVLICAAGMAAHLGGVIAAHTILPVIGVPMAGQTFCGLDSLLSMVQMPPGIPVATVSAGSAGAKNAAILAAEILALSDPALAQKIKAFRIKQTEAVLADDAALQLNLAADSTGKPV